MKHKGPQISLQAYYLGSWCIILALALGIGASSQVLSKVISLSTLLMCFWVLLPQRFYRKGAWRIHVLILWLFMFTLWIQATFVFFKDQRLVGLMSTVLASFLPLFLYRKQKMFGAWMAFLVVAALALIGVILSNGLAEYSLFLLFLLALVFNLNAVNLVILAGPNLSRIMVLPRGHFRQFTPSIFWGILSAIIIFLFFPRAPALNNPFGIREKGVNTGYTGAVTLKAQSELNASASTAMMVESNDPNWLMKKGSDIYFRGNTLDFFDGETWSESAKGEFEYSEEIDLRHSTAYDLHAKQLKIYREPHTTRAVIYPNVLIGIKAPLRLLSGLLFDRNGNLSRGHSEEIRYSYELLVADPIIPKWTREISLNQIRKDLSSPQTPHPLPTMPHGGGIRRFLQLPYQISESNFFSQWLAEVGTERKNEGMNQLMQKLRLHFAEKFSPSMSYQLSSKNAFEAFLTKDRKGHCEYFATATALYLRAHGIPSRMVLGYHGGTYNEMSKALEVKEMHAHAWVEAFLPGLGWLTIEATPAAPVVGMSKLEAYLQLYLGAAKFWANRYVVDYNNITQRHLVSSIATVSKLRWGGVGGIKLEISRHGVLLGVAFSIVLIHFLRKKVFKDRKESMPEYYRRFLRKLFEKGIEKQPQETYREFHLRLRTLKLNPELVDLVNQSIERDLYSNVRTSPQQVELIFKSLAKS